MEFGPLDGRDDREYNDLHVVFISEVFVMLGKFFYETEPVDEICYTCF